MANPPTGVRDLLSRMIAVGEHLQQNGHAVRGAVFHWKQQIQLDRMLPPTCNALEPPVWYASVEKRIKEFNRIAERDKLARHAEDFHKPRGEPDRLSGRSGGKDKQIQTLKIKLAATTKENNRLYNEVTSHMQDYNDSDAVRAEFSKLRSDNRRIMQEIAAKDAMIKEMETGATGSKISQLEANTSMTRHDTGRTKDGGILVNLSMVEEFLRQKWSDLVGSREEIVAAIAAKHDEVKMLSKTSEDDSERVACHKVVFELDTLLDATLSLMAETRAYRSARPKALRITEEQDVWYLADSIQTEQAILELLEGWEVRAGLPDWEY